MPEAGNFEQCINALFMAQTSAGRWMGLEQVVPEALQVFERQLEACAARAERGQLDGLPAVLEVIQGLLPDSRPRPANHRA